jgi:hypothetical protein
LHHARGSSSLQPDSFRVVGNPYLIALRDQYSFIKKGVPSVKADVGFELGTPEQKIFKDWLTNRYHAPSDDVNQPVDLQSAALYEEFTRRLLLEMANSPARPQWKAESFFRRYAGD